MRYLFLLFFFVGFANASEFWIYSYGDVSNLKQTFNYLAMIKQDKTYMTLLQVAIVSGIFITITFKRFSPYSTMTTLAGATLIVAAIFQTTCTVHIVNVQTYENGSGTVNQKNYAAVDNVPYVVGFLSSTFKTIGYNSSRLSESLLHLIGDGEHASTSFLKVGTLGSITILSTLQNIDFENIDKVGAEFDGYYNEYQIECIKNIAYPLNRNEVYTLLNNSKNILADTNPNGSNEIINVIKNQRVDTSLGVLTCGEFHTILLNKQELLHEGIRKIVRDRLENRTGDVFEAAGAATKLFTQSQGGTAEQQVVNYVLANAQMRSFAAPWTTAEQQGAYGSALAESQILQMGKVNAQTAVKVIPVMHSILESVIYTAAPFLLLFGLASFNIQMLKTYLQALIWIEMWPPSFSILNTFIEYEAATGASDKLITSANRFPSDQMLTMVSLANAHEIYGGIATQAAIASNLLWLVPVISGFLMYGSFSALQNMTSSFMQSTAQAGNIDAQMEQKALAAATERTNQSLGTNMSPGEAIAMNKFLSNVSDFSSFKGANALGMDGYSKMKANESLYSNTESSNFYNGFGGERALSGEASTAGQSRSTSTQTQNRGYEKNLDSFGSKENMIEQISSSQNHKTHSGVIDNLAQKFQEDKRANGQSWSEYKTDVSNQLARQSVIQNEAGAQTISQLSDSKIKDLALHGEETRIQKDQHLQSQTQKENETFANNIEKIVGADMQKDLVKNEIDRLRATSQYKNAGDATVEAAAQANVFKALASDSIYNSSVTKATVDKQMAAFSTQEETEKISAFMSTMNNEDKASFAMAQHASRMLLNENLPNSQRQYWSNVKDENTGVFEKDYQSFLSSNEAAAISAKYDSQREDFRQAIFASGAVRAGANGQFEYKDTVKDLRNGELDLNKNLELRETWGQRDGSKISTVDIRGRDVTLSDDVRGQTMTDFVKAQRGQHYEGELRYDPTFFVDEKIDRDNRTTAAVGVSAFETALKTVGIGKFVAGARSMNSMSKSLDDVAENTKKQYWNFKAHKKGDE
jgi:hypothetical protein